MNSTFDIMRQNLGVYAFYYSKLIKETPNFRYRFYTRSQINWAISNSIRKSKTGNHENIVVIRYWIFKLKKQSHKQLKNRYEMERATYNIKIHGSNFTSILDLALAIYLTKGPVIFNAGYWGWMNQGEYHIESCFCCFCIVCKANFILTLFLLFWH